MAIWLAKACKIFIKALGMIGVVEAHDIAGHLGPAIVTIVDAPQFGPSPF